ncbi:MAG: hypothetical protein AB2404_12955, partial [Planifilum fimeticola]
PSARKPIALKELRRSGVEKGTGSPAQAKQAAPEQGFFLSSLSGVPFHGPDHSEPVFKTANAKKCCMHLCDIF